MIKLNQVSKSYYLKESRVTVFDKFNFQIEKGAFWAIMGPSGSGKSTFLNLLGGVDRVDSGEYWYNDERIDGFSEEQFSKWRARYVTFIFQGLNLLNNMSAIENVELPLLLTKMSAKERKKRVMNSLELVGLSNRADHFPDQLSGGQQQRVAIARSLVSDTEVMLCDEPTGNIDRDTTEEIMSLFKLLNTEFGKTIILVTHDMQAAEYANEVYNLNKSTLTKL
ncbi:MAG: putative ABC transport system ATP-binding protein [Arenicella sp.]|jgi:putative ABC transport system ATP-binding protein